MILLQFVAGSLKGSEVHVDRLPVWLGRDTDVDVRIGDDGVFGRHAQIFLTSDLILQLDAKAPAFAFIRGTKTHSDFVRAGDQIGLGASVFRLALDAPLQRSISIRETLLWLGIVLLITAQLWFMFKLG